MALCQYEKDVLFRIAFKDKPDEPNAAWFAACEVLAKSGYVRDGELTNKGKKELVNHV